MMKLFRSAAKKDSSDSSPVGEKGKKIEKNGSFETIKGKQNSEPPSRDESPPDTRTGSPDHTPPGEGRGIMKKGGSVLFSTSTNEVGSTKRSSLLRKIGGSFFGSTSSMLSATNDDEKQRQFAEQRRIERDQMSKGLSATQFVSGGVGDKYKEVQSSNARSHLPKILAQLRESVDEVSVVFVLYY